MVAERAEISRDSLIRLHSPTVKLVVSFHVLLSMLGNGVANKFPISGTLQDGYLVESVETVPGKLTFT
jgi:hypothetical protein